MRYPPTEVELWVRRCHDAKVRIIDAADAHGGLIGDPTEFDEALIAWAHAHGMDADADQLQESVDAQRRQHVC